MLVMLLAYFFHNIKLFELWFQNVNIILLNPESILQKTK